MPIEFQSINHPRIQMFTETPREAAQLGLLALMSSISEEHYRSTWRDGLEVALWRIACKGGGSSGNFYAPKRQATLLHLLSQEAGGWWHWSEGKERFIGIDDWLAVVKEHPNDE